MESLTFSLKSTYQVHRPFDTIKNGEIYANKSDTCPGAEPICSQGWWFSTVSSFLSRRVQLKPEAINIFCTINFNPVPPRDGVEMGKALGMEIRGIHFRKDFLRDRVQKKKTGK